MNWKHKLLLFVLVVVVSVSVHRDHLFSFPYAVHSWSQTDHLALSHGFLKNDFNFFLPETYMQNKVYTLYDNSVTAVDFPINNYAVALAMKVSGLHSAAPFRLYMLLYSCIGLCFLFLLAYHKSHSYVLASCIIIFVFGSAVYLDYQDGLIPSISALSNVFIAAYYLDSYWTGRRKKHFAISIAFLTLSALVRTPYALFLIALLLEWIVRWYRKSGIEKYFELRGILIGLLIPLLYYLYNGHLRAVYGTLFLSKPLPPKSWNEALDIVNNVLEKWVFHYWSLINYIAIGSIVLVTIFWLVKWRSKFFLHLLTSRLSLWIIISTGGGLAYMLLMFHQFSQHDYYLLDSWFVPTVLVFAVVVVRLHNEIRYKKILLAVLAAICLVGFRGSLEELKLRRAADPTCNESRAHRSYLNANSLLDRLHVTHEKKLLVPDTYAPNLPLIAMQRDAYSVPYPTAETVETIMGWDWDYILLQDYEVEQLFVKPFPHILDSLHRIGGDGRISVCTKSKSVDISDIGLIEWLGIEKKVPFLVDSAYQVWERFTPFSENKDGWVRPDSEYDLSKAFEGIDAGTDAGIHLIAEMDFELIDRDRDIFLTVVLEQPDKTLLVWQACALKDVLPDEQGNRKLKKFFGLPELKPNQKLMISFWNPGKNEMFYRNLKLSLYDGED